MRGLSRAMQAVTGMSRLRSWNECTKTTPRLGVATRWAALAADEVARNAGRPVFFVRVAVCRLLRHCRTHLCLSRPAVLCERHRGGSECSAHDKGALSASIADDFSAGVARQCLCSRRKRTGRTPAIS
jgi:hypothetical protein